MSNDTPSADYLKWHKWAFEQRYGEGSWDRERGEGEGAEANHVPKGFVEYSPGIRKFWDEERALGVLEREGKFFGIACLVAKEVVDKESYVRRFGLSFEKDVQWRAVAGLLDHLSRSPTFKAVLVTTSKIPFKLEADVPEELQGRLNWAERNHNYHKEKADTLKLHIEGQGGRDLGVGTSPLHLPKQMKEEEDYAKKFLDEMRQIEGQVDDHLRPYFQIKENLFAAALFFYVYTDAKDSFQDCLREIEARKHSAKQEIMKTYFVAVSDVKDPLIAFNPEFSPFFR